MQLHKSFRLHDTATLEERARAINWLFEEVNDAERAFVCRREELVPRVADIAGFMLD
jgi:hypothetical protein